MPHTETTVSRRRVLLGTAALALLGGAVSACGSTPERDPALDILTGELDRARSDSQLAAAAATGVPPQLVPALTSVAALRDAHARALADELTRMGSAPPPAPSSTTETSATANPPGATPTPAPAPPTPQEVVAALEHAADSTGRAAAGQSGYRAGLLASISAACTAALTVTLAGQAP